MRKALSALAVLLAVSVIPAFAASDRAVLVLDGGAPIDVASVSGGEISAEVITEALTTSLVQHKHITNPRYGDFVITVPALTPELRTWVNQTFARNYSRKNVSLLTVDTKGNVTGGYQVFNAILTGFTIPAGDSSSNEPAMPTLRIAPEYFRATPSSAKLSLVAAASPPVARSVRFSVNDIGPLTSGVIGPIDIQMVPPDDGIGDPRDYQKEPGTLEIPNLRLKFSDPAEARAFLQWHDDFVVKGNCSQDKEKSATLEFVATNTRTGLRIDFSQVGIFSASVGEKGSVEIGLYAEGVTLP